MRTPRAVTPLRHDYIVIGAVLNELGDRLYEISMDKFVAMIMTRSHGSFHPHKARQIYRDLMIEAGLQPLYEEIT